MCHCSLNYLKERLSHKLFLFRTLQMLSQKVKFLKSELKLWLFLCNAVHLSYSKTAVSRTGVWKSLNCVIAWTCNVHSQQNPGWNTSSLKVLPLQLSLSNSVCEAPVQSMRSIYLISHSATMTQCNSRLESKGHFQNHNYTFVQCLDSKHKMGLDAALWLSVSYCNIYICRLYFTQKLFLCRVDGKKN